MTHRDPIVAEVRKHREALARELGDIDAIVAAFQREDASAGTPTVSFRPKRISLPTSRAAKKVRPAAKRNRAVAQT
jgi:uncharacterized protein with WD repeat